MRPTVWIPFALFALLAITLAVGLTRDPKIIPSALIDTPAPEFALASIYDGVPGLSSEDFKSGETVLLNIYASWCGPCRVEHPYLTELAEEGVTIFGLAYKDKADESRAFLAQYGDPYKRIGMDLDGRTGIEFGVYGAPETFVISGDGHIRYKHVGPILPNNQNEIREAIKQATLGTNPD